MSWNFDREPAGRCPPGWSVTSTNPGNLPGVWKVAEDAQSPSRPHALMLVETQNTGHTYNLAILDAPRLKDLRLEVKVRGDAGKEDQGGGLIWRAKDEKNYYICRVNPLEKNYRVYKVVDSKRTQLATAVVDLDSHRWYHVSAEMIGDKITCSLDGEPLLHVEDDTFQEAGRIGVWTKADAATSFDDMTACDLSQRAQSGNP